MLKFSSLKRTKHRKWRKFTRNNPCSHQFLMSVILIPSVLSEEHFLPFKPSVSFNFCIFLSVNQIDTIPWKNSSVDQQKLPNEAPLGDIFSILATSLRFKENFQPSKSIFRLLSVHKPTDTPRFNTIPSVPTNKSLRTSKKQRNNVISILDEYLYSFKRKAIK